MLRHSPLPPLLLSSLLALVIALTGARTDTAPHARPTPQAPGVRNDAAPPPDAIDASSEGIEARRPDSHQHRRALRGAALGQASSAATNVFRQDFA